MIEINGRTKITGLFGYPVEHTLSPAMHNSAFKSLGLDYCYIPFLVHPDYLEDAVKAIKALNICGVNVTVPHKEKVIKFLDEINEEASSIGAVNTIVNTNGRLIGYNTDGRGFIKSLSESGISIEGKDILIVGAGGASRAISYYLSQKTKKLYLYNRNKDRAEKLVQDMNKIRNNVSSIEDISNIEKFHIIINATPLGLKKEDTLPFDTASLRRDQTVCDLIYKKTRLLEEASQKGCATLDGKGMLLWQGVFAFELWTGKKPGVEVMRNALLKAKT
ncbi:MAG: shikimate dehydrogenase [Nitrospirae bacterium CG_4_10_14_0_8_um_filter_41_23]|nr:shikimate dehydrogenase [Nitrospirota bacterium]OIP59575.1 MAG: shikimate dehydrogenase [Nitrospirae bacterium CG2_30_41_42]PIQ93330.1 MAG: shikimate dehydrogenase [Nitrospirae bacterium CG11_big_fil_rev_8_21_14_0_20_41_14]PIV44373.1 MAG: shikimate dehydrogenase [Nitrospirae bacterium CG02_land_8_20_14_3_00_41_53]PIW86903.1 MAG: shikimate dehydrogenase [Nitrospirae bacterium CG_4_8_14_3_um_filter_41_47]PIY87457.1 MAG: shikimate dehydrogenase [Nitrospirae bacterium CG_4_10_14_0_8_um_filter_4